MQQEGLDWLDSLFFWHKDQLELQSSTQMPPKEIQDGLERLLWLVESTYILLQSVLSLSAVCWEGHTPENKWNNSKWIHWFFKKIILHFPWSKSFGMVHTFFKNPLRIIAGAPATLLWYAKSLLISDVLSSDSPPSISDMRGTDVVAIFPSLMAYWRLINQIVII